jgi:colanic acid biosynthesis protein WcaH
MLSDNLWSQIVANVPVVCVDVAIFEDGQVLLVKRAKVPAAGHWWLPGGRVLKGESLVAAAMRKAREEVGLDCFIGPVIHWAETQFPECGGFHSVNTVFLAFPSKTGKVVLDDTSLGYAWVNVIDDDFHPYVKDCLRAAGLR